MNTLMVRSLSTATSLVTLSCSMNVAMAEPSSDVMRCYELSRLQLVDFDVIVTPRYCAGFFCVITTDYVARYLLHPITTPCHDSPNVYPARSSLGGGKFQLYPARSQPEGICLLQLGFIIPSVNTTASSSEYTACLHYPTPFPFTVQESPLMFTMY